MSIGDLLIVNSARLVVLFYLLRSAADFLPGKTAAERPSPSSHARQRERWALWTWTVGCAIYLAHVAFAFRFLHHWSHAAALAHTAHRTFETVGVNWGGGIYINYVFTLLWVFDVAWWWERMLHDRPTPKFWYWTVQVLFAFMMFNATVIFGPPFWRWIAGMAIVLLVGFRVLRRRVSDLPQESVS